MKKKHIFENFMMSLPDKTKDPTLTQFTGKGHSCVSLTYCDFKSYW